MTRLLRDGFGIGALPPALVAQELERGELTRLSIGTMPPGLPLVMSWRGGTGLELVDQIADVSKAVVAHYAENVGKDCFVPAELKTGDGHPRSL
ncbi:hypothetical protein D9M73_189930 [compost metagenome]